MLDGVLVPMFSVKNLTEWLRESEREIPFKDRKTLDVLADFFDKEHTKCLDEMEVHAEDSENIFNDEE